MGLTPNEALLQLNRLRERGRHHFVPDDVEMVVGPEWQDSKMLGHRSVADAHLLALARRDGAALATLDAGLVRLAGDRPQDVLVLRPRD